MAKPIFVIRMDVSFSEIAKEAEKLIEKMADYHVLFVPGPLGITFEIYNAINATDVEIEEIKALALQTLKGE
jgi:hypothetical protein